MVPLGTLPKLFQFSSEELPAELRSQRVLNKARIPEIKDYILSNPNSYVFSALTASVDGDITFRPIDDDNFFVGKVTIPMSARLIINDGQHRRAAIEAALKANPQLKYEHISVVLYSDKGLRRSQQIFADLNRYAIRPTKSLNILYDSRDEFSTLVREMADELEIFRGRVEKERSTIPNRSKALFTLSGIFHGTEALLQDLDDLSWQERTHLTRTYWSEVFKYMPKWQDVAQRKQKASDLRKNSVCAHSIALIALGRVGNCLIKQSGASGLDRLVALSTIDWDKDNPAWAGSVVTNGHISGNRSSTQALTDYIASVILDRQVEQNG